MWSLKAGGICGQGIKIIGNIFDFYSLKLHMHVQRPGKNFIHIDLYTSYGIYQIKLTSLNSVKSCLHLVEVIVDHCSLHAGEGVDVTDAAKSSDSNMKKTVDNTLSDTVMKQYTDIMNSVGALVGWDQLIGTVFRVGSKYVMTAWHCIQGIIGK